jgi:PRTRC genetic system protein F
LNTVLQLPKVDPRIPAQLVPMASRARGALLARSLLKAGLINGQTIPPTLEDDHAKNCQRALANWMNVELGGLRCIRPQCRLSVGHLWADGKPAPLRAEFAWYGSGGTWAVGAALEALEAVSPKLGMTVLRTIEEAAWRTLPIFTPTMVFEAACDLYWYGEDNEEAALEENCGDDEAGRDAMRADMVTRRSFDEAYPKWAIGLLSRSRPLSVGSLRRCLEIAPTQQVESIVGDVIELKKIKLAKPDWSDKEGRFIGFAGMFTWGDGDSLSTRVVDDYEQMVSESGEYFEESGSRIVSIDQTEEFVAWADEMKAWCRAVRLIDGLIFSLTTGDWTRQQKGAA